MSDPFLITEPTCLSFSGGRTSGYMTHRFLKANGGRLPPWAQTIFCNTGRERNETLDFVERCSQQWDLPIVWLEYDVTAKHKFRVVDYASASRDGRPFNEIIARKQMLPNVVMRFCTQWLKIKISNRYCRHIMGWNGKGQMYNNAIGLRADEPRRVARLKAQPKTSPHEEPYAPLAKAGVTVEEVMAFWQAAPFDLQLRPDEGNCTLCFLKGQGKLLRLMRERPQEADWWIQKEAEKVGKTREPGAARFRKNAPSYQATLKLALETTLFPEDEGEQCDCRCTD